METFPGGKGRLGKRAGGLDKTNTWGGGFRTLDSRTTSWYPSQQSRCNNDTYQPTVIPDDHWVSRNVSKFRPTHLRMMKDRTIVKAGEEKNMAVQSPSGILSWIIFKVKKCQVGNTWKLPQISWEEETLQGSLGQLLSTWVLELGMIPSRTKNLWFKRYLVAKSGVPNMFCPERYTRGSMVTSWGMAG